MDTAVRILGVMGLVGSLSSCTTVSVVSDYCNIAKPIFLAKGEAKSLSDETAKEILLHNDTWDSVCNKNKG